MKTKKRFTSTDEEIKKEISRLFQSVDSDIGLIAMINSWKDTQDDQDVLLTLKAYKTPNIRYGEIVNDSVNQ